MEAVGRPAGNGEEALQETALRFEDLINAARAHVEVDLPTSVNQRFVVLGQQMHLDAPAAALEGLTVKGGSRRDWLIPFRSAVLNHVREGLTASYYHLENIRRIEAEMIAICRDRMPTGEPPLPQGVTIAPGAGDKLNFEYQAFRFALKRTLDYLAVGVAAAFKRSRAKFSTVEKAIATREPADVRERVCRAVALAKANLSDILGRPSVRDRIAHSEAVPAGVLEHSLAPRGDTCGPPRRRRRDCDGVAVPGV